MSEEGKTRPRRFARLTTRSINLGSFAARWGSAAIADQATRTLVGFSARLEQRRRPQAAFAVVLERPDPEVLDLMRSLARPFREHAVERAAEHPAEHVERGGRERPAAAPRARSAHGAALVEVECHQIGVAALALAAATRAVVEHRVEAL